MQLPSIMCVEECMSASTAKTIVRLLSLYFTKTCSNYILAYIKVVTINTVTLEICRMKP
jgi:uncharacterized protein (UPF0333 family)